LRRLDGRPEIARADAAETVQRGLDPR
jgi:hypothetical protein